MQLSELVDAVELVIQDSSFSEATIISYLNEAQNEVSGGVQSTLGSWLIPPLPDLLTIDTISTSTDYAYVSMPSDFQRNLQLVVSAEDTEIDIANSFLEFTETYPALNKAGSVVECCEFGSQFYYQGIPTTSVDLTIHYYKVPTDMADDTDEPDGIPNHLHRGLLINHACWKFFELIEDGISGPGVNTEKYMNLFLHAARTLELFIPYENRSLELF
jgi:hypothetical protein